MRAHLTADLPEIGRALDLGPLSGRAKVAAELTARGQTPALDGRVDIADLTAAGRPVEDVAATFHMAPAPGADTRWEGTVQAWPSKCKATPLSPTAHTSSAAVPEIAVRLLSVPLATPCQRLPSK